METDNAQVRTNVLDSGFELQDRMCTFRAGPGKEHDAPPADPKPPARDVACRHQRVRHREPVVQRVIDALHVAWILMKWIFFLLLIPAYAQAYEHPDSKYTANGDINKTRAVNLAVGALKRWNDISRLVEFEVIEVERRTSALWYVKIDITNPSDTTKDDGGVTINVKTGAARVLKVPAGLPKPP